MIRTIPDGGINWSWYLQAEFNDVDMTCHIYFYDRWHRYEHRGSYHPVATSGLGRLSIYENEHRIIESIRIGDKTYKVTNPDHVFSYRDMTHYVADKT